MTDGFGKGEECAACGSPLTKHEIFVCNDCKDFDDEGFRDSEEPEEP